MNKRKTTAAGVEGVSDTLLYNLGVVCHWAFCDFAAALIQFTTPKAQIFQIIIIYYYYTFKTLL